MNLLHHQIDSHSVNDALFDKPNMIYQREEINTISYINSVNLLLLRPWEKTNLSITFLFYFPYGEKKKTGLKGNSHRLCNSLKVKSERESHSVMSNSLWPHELLQSMEFSRPEYWSG